MISADEAEARCGRYEEQGIKHMYFLQTRYVCDAALGLLCHVQPYLMHPQHFLVLLMCTQAQTFYPYRCGALIDATMKGNKARFINHSCEPNCQAEYWTVEGRERVGIFATKLISEGQEITYDYHAICADVPVIR